MPPLVILFALALLAAPAAASSRPVSFVTGTAFLYNDKGDMFTNRHVIEHCRTEHIAVQTSRGRVSSASILAVSNDSDLAAISTDIKQDEFASIRVSENGFVLLPETHEDVFTAGYSRPLANSFKVQLKWGQVQGFVDADGKAAAKSFENIARMDVYHGASGSPVLDYAGMLVGIVSARSIASVVDSSHLNDAGYGDKLVHLYNNDAIAQFAIKHGLDVHSGSGAPRQDPVFILGHLDRITALVACLAK